MNHSTLQALKLFLGDDIEFKNFIELLGLIAGLKPVVRLAGSPDQLATIENALRPFVDHVERSPLGLVKVYSNRLSDSFYKAVSGSLSDFDLMVTYLGDSSKVAEAIGAETTGCDDEEIARTLGYPRCCAKNYASIKSGQHWIGSYMRGTGGLIRAPWQANKIAYLFAPGLTLLPDYFPCSVFCQSTWQLAHCYHSVLCEHGFTEIERAVKQHLTGLAVVVAGELLYVTNYAMMEHGWIKLKGPEHRLRFDPGLKGIPPKAKRVRVLSGRVAFEVGETDREEVEIACGNEEGGVLFS